MQGAAQLQVADSEMPNAYGLVAPRRSTLRSISRNLVSRTESLAQGFWDS